MATVYLIVGLIIAVLAVIFALQNVVPVTISFFTWEITGSLSLVLLVTLAIGAIIGLLVIAPAAVKNKLRASSHSKRIGLLEKELDEHKAKTSEVEKPPVQIEEPKIEAAEASETPPTE